MRERVLQAARELAVEYGWQGVRLAELAARAQVSRPTVYKEFGDRAGIGEALIRRESEHFLTGIAAALARHPADMRAALSAAMSWTLTEAAANPLVRAMLRPARDGHADDLLAFLTTRPDPVFSGARTLLADWLSRQLPEAPREAVTDAVETLVRLTASHIVLPSANFHRSADRLAAAVLHIAGASR
ncbi:TetR family transcriptional regulator [Streptacidiphilus griseoplanus]|uniref:TetR family transcriptional regulator n=1 Tax=Peterkaempfera griseoplana TaxID=66896 RepID=UPI0006E404E2|nr:TetR family transcriptional regulator [Peterkaempfera griseoplana]